ncbi:MAG: cupin domain-containing protein [Mitsuokella sp.]|uniref:cupin domain-containing protein n=1 Tax=Mitsuokella sp. TaxID=2049034 RepID=UPI003F036A57
MAFIEPAPMQANKGIGTISLVKLLTPAELDGKCDMYAKVIVPPLCGIDVHKHEGNTETYHILSGEALYNDNGTESVIGAGTTTFCPDGEKHGIRNISKTEDLVFMALIIRK